jgi:hypothetical protein
MPSDRQFLRYGVPGWVATLFFFFLLATAGMFSVDMTTFGGALRFGQTIEGTLLLAGAGIPLGYIIYQVYFLFRWSGELKWLRDVPKDVVERTISDIPERRLTSGNSWRQELWSRNDYRGRWNYLEGLWREKVTTPQICTRADELMDTFHALGACMWACILSLALYFLYSLHVAGLRHLLSDWIPRLLIPTTIACVVVWVIRKNRLWAENRVIDFYNYFLKRYLEAKPEEENSLPTEP